MAKIHIVEWTPANPGSPDSPNWNECQLVGLIGEKLNNIVGRAAKSEVIGRIPGSGVDRNNVPFSLTEEFVSVYRMHPLIPG
jgi:hypothetical protein